MKKEVKKQSKKECKTCAMVSEKAKNLWSVAVKHKKWTAGILVAVVAVWAIGSMNCAGGKVGVIDIAGIRTKAEIYQQIIEEQKKHEVVWQIKLNAEKELLTKEDKELAARKDKDANFKREVETFQKKVVAFQQKYQAEYSKILLATQQAVREADQKAGEVALKLGEKKGVSILISKQAVLYANENVDLTDNLIKMLDEVKVKVVYPDPAKMQLPQN